MLSKVTPWRSTVLILAILLLTSWLAWRAVATLQADARIYRGLTVTPDPAAFLSLLPGQAERNSTRASPPLTQGVVLVIVTGLTTDVARRLPNLAELGGSGARAEIEISPPTSRMATWGTLLSGAGPELSGAPLLDPPHTLPQPLQVDTVLTQARKAGLRVSVYGRGPWEALLPADVPREGQAPGGFSQVAATDAAVTEAAREALRRSAVDLAAVVYQHAGLAGALFGTDSVEYLRAAQTVDAQLGLLRRDIDLRRLTVVVTADRGLTDEGRAGGSEAVTLKTPLVLAGTAIRSGEYAGVAQADLAPTVAALLGIEPLRWAQGVARTDLLQMADVTRAQRGLAEAAQKLALEVSLTRALGATAAQGVVAEEVAALPVLTGAMALGNDAGAWRLAEPTARESQRRMAELRRAVQDDAADRRLLPALAWATFLLAAALWRITPRRLALVSAAGLAWLLPLGALADWSGFSAALPGVAALRAVGLTLLLALAMALGLGLWWLWRNSDPRVWRLGLAGGLALAALAISVLTVQSLSLSDYNSGVGLAGPLAWRAGLALTWGLGVSLLLGWWEEADLLELTGLAAQAALIVAALVSLEWAALWWAVGSRLEGFLPDLQLVFLEALAVGKLVWLGGGGVVMAGLAALAHQAATFRPEVKS